jgi:hypothetical protein
MICDQYRFVRIHIKKCGGRSFSALFPNLPDTHETIRDYEKKMQDKLNSYFKWTIVRNSWERIVSLFFYLHQEAGFFGHLDRYKNFERFVTDLYFSSQQNSSVFYLGKWPFESQPQIEYLKNSTGKIKLDYFCYLPRIKDDFEVIKKECNMPHNWNYPHHGKSKHDDYRNYYNDFTAACIGSLYAEEINYFKFSFDDRDQFGF